MGAGYDNANLDFQRMDHDAVLKDLKEIIVFLKKINSNNKIFFRKPGTSPINF